MDQKSSPWKIRSTEKKAMAADRKANISLFSSNKEDENEEHEHELVTEKAEVERDVRILKDKLYAALSDCSSKDKISMKQVKIAQEAIAGIDKSEALTLSLRNDLVKALQQKSACEEQLIHLDTSLKECTQQLHFVRNEQEKRVLSAIMKTSQESDITKFALEERLAEATKRIARLDTENNQFKKSLLKKDKVVEELSRYRSRVEADLKALILRLESTEKENASLQYEVRVLERELEIRHEEREFNRRTAEVTQKQHEVSVEKIAKLESECQRLRSLIRKRLPGPAALVRMKHEVEGPEKDQFDTRRGKSTPEAKMLDFLNEQLQKMEEENKKLKHALDKKYERGKYLATLSEMGSDDKTESWASGSISEFDHFKNEKKSGTQYHHRYIGTPDMDLMDDFAEMEKLAYSPQHSGVAESLPGEDDKIFRVFQCQTSEFYAVVQRFVETCNDLLTEKGEEEQFAISVASNLEWILNHSAESDNLSIRIEEADKGLNLKPENKESSVVIDLEGTLQSQIDKVESFRIQLIDSKDITENSQLEMQTVRQSEDNIGDQTEEQKMMKQEKQIQLVETNLECNKPCEEISHQENDMENNEKKSKEQDEPCNELKSQLEGEASKEDPYDENQLQNDQEITSASEKLAECQETLRNLGKQLKTLDSPSFVLFEALPGSGDAALIDKVVTRLANPVITSISTPQRNGSHRLSLLDKMLADDSKNVQIDASPRTKESTQTSHDNSDVTANAEIEYMAKAAIPMAIVPRKKKENKSFLKKLIWWQKKGNSKKRSFS